MIVALMVVYLDIRDLIHTQFVFCSVSVCTRICNSVADKLAAYGATAVNTASCVFMSQTPDFVNDLVSGDMPGSRE